MSDAAQVLDVRTYRLVPGGRDEFDRIFSYHTVVVSLNALDLGRLDG